MKKKKYLKVHKEQILIKLHVHFSSLYDSLFELIIYYTAFDLKSVFDSYVFLTPLIAVLIGFIPGCGPQIIITSTYLMGIIPLSAQIGNAISNDGDALFPVLAISPKVGLIATLYSAVPAIIVSYGYLLIFE